VLGKVRKTAQRDATQLRNWCFRDYLALLGVYVVIKWLNKSNIVGQKAQTRLLVPFCQKGPENTTKKGKKVVSGSRGAR
jgi:hypothetical protein